MLDQFENDDSNSRILLHSLKKGELPEVCIFPVVKPPKSEAKPKDEKQKVDKFGRPITWVSIGPFNLFKARAKPKPSDEANKHTEQQTATLAT